MRCKSSWCQLVMMDVKTEALRKLQNMFPQTSKEALKTLIDDTVKCTAILDLEQLVAQCVDTLLVADTIPEDGGFPDYSEVIVINDDSEEQVAELAVKNDDLTKTHTAENDKSSLKAKTNLQFRDEQDASNDVETVVGMTETDCSKSLRPSSLKSIVDLQNEQDLWNDLETIIGETGTLKSELTTEAMVTSDSSKSGTDTPPRKSSLKRSIADNDDENISNKFARSDTFQFGKQDKSQGYYSQFNSQPQGILTSTSQVITSFVTKFVPGIPQMNQPINTGANDLRRGTKGNVFMNKVNDSRLPSVQLGGLPEKKTYSSSPSCTVSRHPDASVSGFTGASANSYLPNNMSSSAPHHSSTQSSPLRAASHHGYTYDGRYKMDQANAPLPLLAEKKIGLPGKQADQSAFMRYQRHSTKPEFSQSHPKTPTHFAGVGSGLNLSEIPTKARQPLQLGMQEQLGAANLNNAQWPGGLKYLNNQVGVNSQVNSTNSQVHSTNSQLHVNNQMHTNRQMNINNMGHTNQNMNLNGQMFAINQVNIDGPVRTNSQMAFKFHTDHQVNTKHQALTNQQADINNQMGTNYQPHINQQVAIDQMRTNQQVAIDQMRTNQQVAIDQMHTNQQVAIDQVRTNHQAHTNQQVAIDQVQTDNRMNIAIEPPKEEDNIDVQMVEVVNLIPDIQLEFLRNKLKDFQGGGNEVAVQRAVNYLLENPYPKQVKENPKKASSQNEETDYFEDFTSFPSREYSQQVVMVMQARHLKLSTKFLRDVLHVYNYHFAPTEKAVQDLIRTNKTLAECLTAASKMTYQGDVLFTAGNKRPKLKVKSLKCGRASTMPSKIIRELQREIDFYETHMLKEIENKDRELAVTLNGQEYEQEGQLIECGCCYGEVAFEDMVQCSDGHLFCSTCMNSYAREAVYGSGKLNLFCMTDGCEAGFPKSQLDKCLSKDIIDKYEERQKEESLNLADIDNLVKCPSCSFAAIMDTQDKVFSCQNPECLKETCRYCKESWKDHFGLPCSEIEKKDETTLRVSYEERMTNAKMRTCFRCKTGYMKIDGCNKITCRCGAKMCYICRKPNIDYNHFCQHVRNPGQGCKTCQACSLWSDPKEDDERAVKEIKKQLQEERKAKGFKIGDNDCDNDCNDDNNDDEDNDEEEEEEDDEDDYDEEDDDDPEDLDDLDDHYHDHYQDHYQDHYHDHYQNHYQDHYQNYYHDPYGHW